MAEDAPIIKRRMESTVGVLQNTITTLQAAIEELGDAERT
jgi:hypothetical protein